MKLYSSPGGVCACLAQTDSEIGISKEVKSMNDPARTTPQPSGSGRSLLTRKPVALAAAAAISAALLGGYAISDRNIALAETLSRFARKFDYDRILQLINNR